MVVMCNATVITEHDGRRPGLSDAPAVMDYDHNITEEYL
jgi:hypothetical protein